MTSTMSSGTKLVKQDKLRYWMDPNEHLSGTTVPKLVTAWADATFTNTTYSSDNQGIYVMSSGGKIAFPNTGDITNESTANVSNPLKNIWRHDVDTLNRTMSAWVYCTSGNSVAIYYSTGTGSLTYDNHWSWVVRSDGKLRLTLNNIGADGYYESTSSMVDYNAWTYLTMTTEDNGLSGSNRMFILKFYKNGVFVENPSPPTYTQSSGFNFNEGSSPYTPHINQGYLFDGDDHKAGPFYMHDVTLTAGEIKRNYMQHKSRFQ